MPAASGPDVACEYDGAGVALELAALAAFVVLLRYAAVLYANHLLATLCVDDGLPAGRSYSDAWVFPGIPNFFEKKSSILQNTYTYKAGLVSCVKYSPAIHSHPNRTTGLYTDAHPTSPHSPTAPHASIFLSFLLSPCQAILPHCCCSIVPQSPKSLNPEGSWGGWEAGRRQLAVARLRGPRRRAAHRRAMES